MSNTKKDGDFSLDEELMDKIVANEDGQPFADEHEDEKELIMYKNAAKLLNLSIQ